MNFRFALLLVLVSNLIYAQEDPILKITHEDGSFIYGYSRQEILGFRERTRVYKDKVYYEDPGSVFYEDYLSNPTCFLFWKEDGSLGVLEHKNIKNIELIDNQTGFMLISDRNDKRFVPVVATNEKYVLSYDFGSAMLLRIYIHPDYQATEEELKQIKTTFGWKRAYISVSPRKDKNKLEALKMFFPNCSELYERMYNNIESLDYRKYGGFMNIYNVLFHDIVNINCD